MSSLLGDVMSEAILSGNQMDEPRPIEVITAEIQILKVQVGSGLIEIGNRLLEAKTQLSHGEWLPWLEQQVQFSETQAQRFMRLAKAYPNPSPVTDLGMRKALALLAFDPDDRDAFVAATHMVDGEEKTVADMSARELEQAIQARKEALEAKEHAEAEKQAAEQAVEKMAEDVRFANERLTALSEEAAEHAKAAEDLRRELEELRAQPIDVVGASVPDEAALSAARTSGAEEARKEAMKEAEEKLKSKIEKAEKAKVDAEAELRQARESMEAMKARAEALEKQVKVSGSRELATASICFEAAQENVNKIFGVVQKLALAGNAEEHNKMVDALHALFAALEARVPKKLEVSES